MGLATERHFTHYHRVLNRATWSARHYFVNSAAEPEFVQFPREAFELLLNGLPLAA